MLPSRFGLVVALGALVVAASLRRPLVVLTAVIVALLAAGATWRVAAFEASPVRVAAADSVATTAEFTVRSDARVVGGLGPDGLLITVSLDRVSLPRGRTVTDAGHATIRWYGEGADDPDSWVVGRRGIVRGTLADPRDRGQVAVISARRLEPVAGSPWWWSASEHVRAQVRHAASAGPADAQALVPAMVDGDDLAISDDLSSAFRRAGLTHLLAVSGTNLTIMLVVVIGVARTLRVRARAVPWLGLLAALALVIVARPDPSVVRAAAMGAVGLLALGRGRADGIRALSVAVVALLALDPWLALRPGFVLSVSATAGLLLLARPLATRFERWLPAPIAMAVAIPIAAQVACTPALVALSGELSLVGLVANVVVAPLVAPTTVLGLAGGLVRLATDPVGLGALGDLVGFAATLPAAGIVAVARLAAQFDGATIVWPGPAWTALLATPVLIVGLLGAARRPAVALGLALALLIAVWRPPDPGWPPPGWRLVSCDVGQGDATVLAVAPGEAIVVDTGAEDEPVDRCLRRLGIERVRALVLTHADADHVAGWAGVVRGRRVDVVLVGSSGGPEIPGVRRDVLAAGQVVRAGPVTARVLWPRAVPGGVRPAEDRNDVSVVLDVRTGGLRVLLTGDVGPEAQRALLRSGVDLTTDVLKVPHHGSPHQDPEFLTATGASVAILSAGRDNSYGHPAPAVMEILAGAGMAWWRTDTQGDLAILGPSAADGRTALEVRARG